MVVGHTVATNEGNYLIFETKRPYKKRANCRMSTKTRREQTWHVEAREKTRNLLATLGPRKEQKGEAIKNSAGSNRLKNIKKGSQETGEAGKGTLLKTQG